MIFSSSICKNERILYPEGCSILFKSATIGLIVVSSILFNFSTSINLSNCPRTSISELLLIFTIISIESWTYNEICFDLPISRDSFIIVDSSSNGIFLPSLEILLV